MKIDEAGGAPRRRSSALRRCITLDAAEFANNYWGRAALRSRADVLDLFGRGAVDELISRHGLRTPFVRMAKDGAVVRAHRYTRSGGAGATIEDQVADDKVLALLADGATLVLQGLHRTWPPLVTFARELSTELGHPVQINAYVTPPQNRGFAAHYDVHDVFVLQIAGTKQWRIHEPVLDDPLGSQPWEQRRADVERRSAEKPVIDDMLAPGDSLYLPRGYIHSATALGGVSIHLTVGMHPYTRYQLAQHLLSLAQDQLPLRASLPMGVDLSDPGVLGSHLRATADLMRDLLSDTHVDQVAEKAAADLMRQTRPEPIEPLRALNDLSSLDAETPLRLRPGLRYRIVRTPDAVAIRLFDKQVTLPANAESAVKAALSGEVVTASQLTGLDAAEQLSVVTRLLREGVLVVV